MSLFGSFESIIEVSGHETSLVSYVFLNILDIPINRISSGISMIVRIILFYFEGYFISYDSML